jgi:sugar phosphate isomerase/epimerase
VFVSAVSAAPFAMAAPKLKLCVFSKHLQWAADYGEMAAIARDAGFDGVDITVRPRGHVLPERVAEDLPRAVEAVRRAGLDVPMITAGIVDADTAHAADVLRAASGLGIRRYRWGGFQYRDDTPMAEQLSALRARVKKLEGLNREFGVMAMYHTHSGMEVGAPIWDLVDIMRESDPRLIAINYDVGHATVEGGLGGWIRSAQAARPRLGGVALKDFLWERRADGKWEPSWRPPGQGMVDFARFFGMLSRFGFDGPVQVHFEYKEAGSAKDGATSLDVPKAELLAAFRRDAAFYRAGLQRAGLA